jgi:hypothetical protein
MNVSLVPLDHYPLCFNAISEYLDGAAKYTHGRYTLEDIKERLLKGDQQLWIAFEDTTIYGCVVTEVITYPQMKTLMMHFTGGKELPKWKQAMLDVLRQFAKESDCKTIESYGRKGWGKVFENDGYKIKFIFYELPLEAV